MRVPASQVHQEAAAVQAGTVEWLARNVPHVPVRIGMVNVNVEPTPIWLSTQMRPP
jgi:hypothetical protein